jgi:hypothetical protein
VSNENFTPGDHSWTVRYGYPAEDSRWTKFFGDEYNWTSMVPILWQSVDSPAARIAPPKLPVSDFTKGLCAWWNGALHLLAFGMGWRHMAKGLREWREGGYRRDNAVLRLVFDTYGNSIEALEYWLQSGQLDHALGNSAVMGEASRPSPQQLEEQLARLTSLVDSGPRHKLTVELLKENDQLHLHHFVGSVGLPEVTPRLIDAEMRDEQRPLRQIRVRLYQGWHGTVSEYLRSQGVAVTPDGVLAEVLVSRVGYLGTYALSHATGLAFRRSPQTEYSSDHEYHLMGN